MYVPRSVFHDLNFANLYIFDLLLNEPEGYSLVVWGQITLHVDRNSQHLTYYSKMKITATFITLQNKLHQKSEMNTD